MVSSETFRQSSAVTEALRERDPENRLLAHYPRLRLPAWMIRDQALALSGLLNPALGGPPVRPWQPPGVWEEIFMGRLVYRPSLGAAQYRRTLYAYWRRSSAPTFLFDSAQRRVCEVRTLRTNTPLHALTLLNDVTLLEASRALADAALRETEPLDFLARRMLQRPLSDEERSVIQRQLGQTVAYYDTHLEEARKLATPGQQAGPALGKEAATAAWMLVASMMFNLDESMTHE